MTQARHETGLFFGPKNFQNNNTNTGMATHPPRVPDATEENTPAINPTKHKPFSHLDARKAAPEKTTIDPSTPKSRAKLPNGMGLDTDDPLTRPTPSEI